MGSLSFTERPARKTRRRFSCCTDFPLHRGCSSLSSPGSPIAITWSRPITPASDTATGRIRKNSRYVRSLRRNHESLHRGAYRRDVPKAEVYVLDAGHFALDTAADQLAQLVRGLMK